MEISAIDTSAAIAANPSFTVSRAALFPVLDIIARKIIDRRNTLPILSNVLIEASPSGELRLTGTNLDMELSATLSAEIEQPGAFTVSAATLRDIVKKADKGAQIRFVADDGLVSIASGRIRQSLPTLPRDDFPIIAVADDMAMFELPSGFVADLAMVAPFAHTGDGRYYLRGVALDVRDIGQGAQLHAVATDGAMMARVSYDAPAPIVGMKTAIIGSAPIAVIQAVAKIAGDHTPIMEISAAKARVTMGTMVLTAKLIDGDFVNWQDQRHDGELSGLFMPELDARLASGRVEAIKKAFAGDLYWEIGGLGECTAALITCPAKPHWQALLMTTREPVYPQGYDTETEGVTVECDGVVYPVATKSGRIHLSAETVQALQGPVDKSTHVHIPEFTMHRGKVVAIDGVPTDAMPKGYRVNVKPSEKQAKALRAVSVAAFWAGDHDRVAEIAAMFEPIVAMLPDEVAMPVATPISEAETVAHVSDEYERPQSAPETQEADAPATLAAPEPEIVLCEAEIKPETAIEPCADPIADVLERLERLERSLAERSAPVTPSGAIETDPPLPVQSKSKRTPAHVRAIMAYLAIRRHREISHDRLKHLVEMSSERTKWRDMAEKSAADYLDMQKQRDDAHGEVQRLKALAEISNEHYCERLDDIAALKAKRRRAVLSARQFQQRLYAEHKLVDRYSAKSREWQEQAILRSQEAEIARNDAERLKRVSYQQAGHIINLGERIDKAEQLLRSNGYWPDITVTAPDVIRMPQLAH